MTRLLRALAVVLLAAGLLICVVATRGVFTDEAYYRTAAALERHAEHVLFQAEYQFALARHAALIFTAVASAITGIVGGATLFALAAILDRLQRLEAPAAR